MLPLIGLIVSAVARIGVSRAATSAVASGARTATSRIGSNRLVNKALQSNFAQGLPSNLKIPTSGTIQTLEHTLVGDVPSWLMKITPVLPL